MIRSLSFPVLVDVGPEVCHVCLNLPFSLGFELGGERGLAGCLQITVALVQWVSHVPRSILVVGAVDLVTIKYRISTEPIIDKK